MRSQMKSFTEGEVQKSTFGKSYAFANLSTFNSQKVQNEIIESLREKLLFSSFPTYEKEKTTNLNYNYRVAKTFKSSFDSNKYMPQSYEQKKIYSLNEIRQYFKKNYGLEVSKNPTEREQKRMFGAWADKMNQTADKIISNQDSMLLELDEMIKKIDSLDKKSR